MTREEFETLRDRAKASGETLKSELKAEGKLNCRHSGHKKEETCLRYIRLTLDEKADDVANAASVGLF